MWEGSKTMSAEQESRPNGQDNENRTTDLAERLTLSYSAQKDFSEALQIGSDINGDFSKTSALGYLGTTAVKIGNDPSGTISQLEQLAQKPSQIYTDYIYENIIDIYLETGDFESAEKLFKFIPYKKNTEEFNFKLARSKAKFAKDPKPHLADVFTQIEELEVDSPSFYSNFAAKYFQTTGEYPEEYLTKARNSLRQHASEYPDDKVHTPVYYADLAKTLALVGDFAKALKLVPKIHSYTKTQELETKADVLEHIANEQFNRDLYEKSIKSANEAIKHIDKITDEPQKSFLQTIEAAKLYIFIAKASHLNGEDYRPHFEIALEKLNQTKDSGYWRMNVLIEAGKALLTIGDSRAQIILSSSLSELDAMPYAEDYDNYYDLVQMILGYEEWAREMAKLGYIQDAKEGLSHLKYQKETFGDTDNEDVVKILSEIACAEAKGGLSVEELGNLSPEDIKTILKGDNEAAKEAIIYFGLNKKL